MFDELLKGNYDLEESNPFLKRALEEKRKKEVKVDSLVGKSENEIKQFLKEVILKRAEKFNWEDFSLKYDKIFANYDEEDGEGENCDSLMSEISTIIETSDDDYYYCGNFINDVFIENGKIRLQCLEGEYIIKDRGEQSALIKFLVKSIMGVCERLNDEDNHLNSLFE